MSDPFVGEIRIFAGNFAPRGWALCDGQLLAVGQNDALFSLLGSVYGGDGRTTFGVPDLRSRVPVHTGTGPGLSHYPLGQKGGAENVTLTVDQLASHGHTMIGGDAKDARPPDPNFPGNRNYYNTEANMVSMASGTIGNTGGSQAHGNEQPFLCLNFIISLVGIYPSRS